LKLNLASLTLLSLLALTVIVGTANLQAQTNYPVTIKPTNPDSPFYTSVGNNWTLSFTANWNNGDAIHNATAAIKVLNSQNTVIETLKFNTTLGVFTFNYSSEDADILTFTPTSLTSMDGQEFTVEDNHLRVESSVIWYDTFQVRLVSYDVDNLGKTVTTVNVTYLLLPDEGLTLPDQTFLPKTVHNATITINGAAATETSNGIFTAESSAWMDTAYVNVRVSQEGWKKTDTAFSFVHAANQQVWIYGVGFVLIAIIAALAMHFVVYRKANNSSKHSNKLFFGLILLIISSVLSLYWGVVAIEAVMHTFDWFVFVLACLFSFAFGIFGSVLVFKKKLQPLAIFAPIVPLIINTVIVKSFLDNCQLASPWVMLLLSAILSSVCIFFVSSSDKALEKPE
jgi:hypothetical protein